ncbi:MAG: hypothetical protein COB02_10845 [Candidatus Cloacimonadota bacterium]|nr:MAG: hypothetical protein COB02_10845 [Candidatus Cloacimonadota bacterium]
MLQKLLPIKKGEGLIVFFLMLYLMVVCIGTSIGIAVSTSLLLENFGASKLPYIFVGISFISLFTSSFYTFIIKKIGCSKLYKYFLLIAFISTLICNILLRNNIQIYGIPIAIIIQYMAFFIFLGIEIINFNNYSSKYLNPIQKKRLYSFILSATKLGGMIGGFSLSYLLTFFKQENVLLIWPFAYFLALLVLLTFESKVLNKNENLGVNRQRKSNFFKDLSLGIQQVKSNHFYFLFALLIALDICCGSLIILQFNEGLGKVFMGKPQELSAFLGKFCAFANIIALFLQMFVAPKLSQKFGVTKINFLFPVISIILLIVSLYSWKLTIIGLLMFHKDYFMSIFHFPNRAQFYNGVESQKKSFFLGFFEGIWTHSVSMIFGLVLIFVVQFLPRYFPILKDGFAYYFSIAGIILFSLYIYIAYQLIRSYKKQLLNLMTGDDVKTKLMACNLSYIELEGVFQSSSSKDVAMYDFMVACDDIYFQKIILSGDKNALWKILELYPNKFKKVLVSLNDNEKYEILNSFNDKYKDFGFDKVLVKDELLLYVDSLNVKRASKYFDCLFSYILLFDLQSLILPLEKYFFCLKESQKLQFLNLIEYYKISLSKAISLKILSNVFKESILLQKISFKALEHSNHIEMLKNLFNYFESNSKSIRKSVFNLTLKWVEKLQDSSIILEYYYERKWSFQAKVCWYNLFSVLDKEFNQIAKKDLFKNEKKELLLLLSQVVCLKNFLDKESVLLEVLSQDIYDHLKFLLLFFEDDFDENSLRIIEKSFLNQNHKYEAIELITSSNNKEVCSLLMAFLEVSSLEETYETLFSKDEKGFDLSKILNDLLDGDDAWVRALTMNEIIRLNLKDFKEKILSFENCVTDLYSGEMAQHCIKVWS